MFTPASRSAIVNNLDVSVAAFVGELYTPFTLTVTMLGDGNGSVHSSPMPDISCIKGSNVGCSGRFGNVDVTLTASPDITTTYFDGWTNACVTSLKDCTITMNLKTAVETLKMV